MDKRHPDCEVCKLFEIGMSTQEWCNRGSPDCNCKELWEEYFKENRGAKVLFDDEETI